MRAGRPPGDVGVNAKTDPAGTDPAPPDRRPSAASLEAKPVGSAAQPAAHEVALVFGTRAGVYGIAIFSQSLLAHLLLPAGRGEYAVCVAFGSVLGVVSALSAANGGQYFAASGRIGLSRCLCGAFSIGLAGSIVAAVAAILLIHSDMAFFQKADSGSFLLALLLVPLISVSYAAEMQLAGLRRFSPLARILLLQSCTVVAGVVVLVWTLGQGVNGAVLALIAGYVVKLACCLRDLRRACGLRFEMPCVSELRRIIGYGLRYHVAQIGNEIEPRVGVFILGALAGRADIGLFAAASTIMLRLGFLPSSVATVLFPRVARGSAEPLETVGYSLRLVCLATAGAVIAFLAVCEPVIRLLLSEAFVPAVPLLWIMAPGIVAYAGSNIFVAYFTGSDRPGVCSSALWLSLVVNIAICLALYPTLGVHSVAWGITAGVFARIVFLAFVFHRATGLSLPSLWLPRRRDATYLWNSLHVALSRKRRLQE